MATRHADRQNAKAAMQWLYTLAGTKMRGVPEEAFNIKRGDIFIGGMFLYQYDPKHKETLPWWDSLPVVIPIEVYKDGWLGLNLHYLPPELRKTLLDKLLQMKKRAHTPSAYMSVSYQMLKNVAQSKLFEPCLHRYLGTQVRSQLIRIDDKYWDKVAQLPIQQFNKATKSKIWGSR